MQPIEAIFILAQAIVILIAKLRAKRDESELNPVRSVSLFKDAVQIKLNLPKINPPHAAGQRALLRFGNACFLAVVLVPQLLVYYFLSHPIVRPGIILGELISQILLLTSFITALILLVSVSFVVLGARSIYYLSITGIGALFAQISFRMMLSGWNARIVFDERNADKSIQMMTVYAVAFYAISILLALLLAWIDGKRKNSTKA